MKITILQGAFLPVPPKLGGAVEKMWFALGKEFASKGHEVVHISRLFNDLPKEELIDGVLHKRVAGYATPASGLYLKWLDLVYTIRAKSAIPDNTDVIVTNTFWAPIIFSQKLKRRCMVDVQRMPKGQMRLYKKVWRLRANSTPVAKAICDELREDLCAQVQMIPNPLPFNQVPVVDLNSKENTVLYAGRIHPEKGLDLLIKAFQLLEGDWSLIIVGPWDIKAGGGGNKYLESLKVLAKSASIKFTGPIYDMEALNGYYRRASIFVYPSVAEQGETFGLAPLEAMAWGCVPVVSNLACFQDFIKHEKNGLVFDHRSSEAVDLLRSSVEQLQKNMPLRSTLADQALKVKESHSTATIASEFIKDFETLLGQ